MPSKFVWFDHWDDGTIGMKGTWTLDNDVSAYPVQVSSIECRRAAGTCTDATATISTTFGNYLDVSTTSYRITNWGSQFITLENSEPLCVRYRYTIDRANETLAGVRSSIPEARGCEQVDKKTLHLSLSDGFDVYRQLLSKKRDENAIYLFGSLLACVAISLLLARVSWRKLSTGS